MRSAVLAVTPTLYERPENLDRLCQQVSALQERGVLGSVSVASVMHPDLYPYPASYYQLVKFGLLHQSRAQLEGFMKKKFKFKKVHMLTSPSSENTTLAEALSEFAKKRRADVLVVNRPAHRGLFSKLFSRVAEVTAFSADLPVLVLNSEFEAELLNSEPRILLGIDPKVAPSEAELAQVISAAKLMGAEVHLAHVRPASRTPSDMYNGRTPASIVMRKLRSLEYQLRAEGVRARSVMLEEDESVAASIEQYAEDNRICMTAVTSPVRPFLRKILLGSTARKLLRLSRRPVFVARAKKLTQPESSVRHDHVQGAGGELDVLYQELQMRQNASDRGRVA